VCWGEGLVFHQHKYVYKHLTKAKNYVGSPPSLAVTNSYEIRIKPNLTLNEVRIRRVVQTVIRGYLKGSLI